MKTNVLFFTRAEEEAPARDATEWVWIYDMRTGAPAYGKTNPIKAEDFAAFVTAFGDDPLGLSSRKDEGESGLFRAFSRSEIAARGDNLDISWLKDSNVPAEAGLQTPEAICSALESRLCSALEEVRALLEEITPETVIEVLAEVAE